MKKTLLSAVLAIVIMLVQANDPAKPFGSSASPVAKPDLKGLTQNRAPLSFMENKGQVTNQNRNPRPDIQFSIKAAPGLNIFIGNGAIHYQFSKPVLSEAEGQGAMSPSGGGVGGGKPRSISAKLKGKDETPTPINYTMYRMDVELIGANTNAQVVTEQKQDYYENYFNENTGEKGATAYTYNRISYKNIYPYIDWVLYMKAGQLEHEFVIHQGGKASDIQLKYGGATGLKVNADGSLTATTPQGTITEQAPKSYQPDGTPVKSGFKLSGYVLSYETGGFKGEMVIDPTLVWGTYFGGASAEYANATATDASGNVYITGPTNSTAAIATTGAYQTTNAGDQDVFLAQFNSTGAIQWATYYGGSAYNNSYGVATDKSGYVYIAGETSSTSGIATGGAYQATYGGNSDAFLAKFSSTGAIQWATYFGGAGNDEGFGVATDSLGNVYLTGYTQSSSGIAGNGAYQTVLGGSRNAFLAKFSSTGARQWATYYGGIYNDGARSVTADKSGNVYIAGNAESPGLATSGAFETAVNNPSWGNPFLAKFSSAGLRLWATYYGGTGSDSSHEQFADESLGVVTDSAENVYITGYAISSSGIASPGAYQTVPDTLYGDAFLAKFNSTGSRQWGTYYGGSSYDIGSGIIIDGSGNVDITGSTESASGISTAASYQPALIGVQDAFIATFSVAGSRLWATYYGSSVTGGFGIAADLAAHIYITGATNDTIGIASPGAYQTIYGGNGDAFLAKFNACSTPTVSPIAGPITLCALGTITLTDTTTGGTWGSSNTNLATVSSGEVSGVAAGLDTITYSVTNGCGTTTVSYPVTVNAAPTINTVTNQTVCAGDTTTTIHFTGTGTGTVYNWTCNNTSIGLAASGTGSIGSFTGVNTGNTPIVDTIIVTPVAPANGYAYIANYSSNTVSVINISTRLVIATINVGTGPEDALVSPDGSEVYVANHGDGSVSVINTVTNLVIATIHNIHGHPDFLAISPDGSKIYAPSGDSIFVINTITNTISSVIPVSSQVCGAAISIDGSKLYVSNCAGNSVSVISTSTNLVTNTIVVGVDPFGVTVSPDGSKIYVANETSDSVSVINTATNLVIATIKVGNVPEVIAVSPDGSKVYVTNENSNNISVIDATSNTVAAIINVGNVPAGVAITSDGNTLYVTNFGSNSVSVINTATNSVVDTIPVGSNPTSLCNFVISSPSCTGIPKTFTITVNPQPTAGITGTVTACGTVSLTATGGTTYAWSGGNTPNNADNAFSSSGTYTVTVSNGGSCSATVQPVVTVNTIPTAGITGTATACGSVSLTATGGTTYGWSGGGSPGTAANTFTSSATYTVTVTNNSCTATASQLVTVNTIPTAGITGTATACGSVSLTATGGTTYTWSGGNTPNNTDNTFASSGTYTVTVSNTSGCSATAQQLVTVNTIPGATITPSGATTFCTGDSVILTASAGTTYVWSNSATTQSIHVKNAGNYTVEVGNANCSATSAATVVTVNALPNAAINGPTTICSGLQATLTASGGAGYSWSNGLGSNAQVNVSPINNTTYIVTVTDANNCSATAQQTVSVTNTPSAGISGPAEVCSGSGITLTANGGNTYSWAGGLGSNATINVSPTSNATYTVTATIGVNCSATASQTLTVNQPGASQFSQSICAGSSYSFNNQNLNQSGAYYDTLQTIHTCDSIVTLNLTVNDAVQTAISDTTCRGTAYLFNGNSLNQTGIYKDTLNAVTTCDSIVTLSLFVDSVAIPTITRTGDSLQTQIFTGYQWLFNGATANSGTNQNLVLVQDGNYSVVVTGANGCSDTSASLSVTGLGVNDMIAGYGVKLYPNPNNGSFVLEFTDDVLRDGVVTDAVGRAVLSGIKVSRQQNFNMEELSAGVYIVRITTAGGMQSLKFSVVR